MKICLLSRKGAQKLYAGFSPHPRKLKFLLLITLSFLSFNLFAQQRITGRVTDRDSSLEGVTIMVKGGTAATQTDSKGNFTITAPSNATLVVSNVGYANQEVKVGGRSSINIQMLAAAGQLTDVVVVGYGTQKKVTVTGSVATVKGTELEKSPTVNLSNSLAGRLPGVTAINSGGEPGFDGSTIRIRGTNTTGNSSALIVIDGVPDRAGGLDRINPADIESMSILKDASAAIYGSRAANGVILITTKQGKSGKPVITYDFNKGFAQPTRIPALADAVQYTELLNEQTLFSSIPVSQWGAAWDAFKKTGTYKRTDNNVTVNAPFQPADIQKYADGSDPWGHPNTDWFKTTMKTWSPQDRHGLQISGGSENIRFLASAGYENQDAYYKNSATGYKQYDMRINLDAKVNKYINANIGLTAREEYRFFPTESAGTVFRMLMRGKPTEPEVWPNGLPGPDIENGQNPIVITTSATGYDRDKRDYFQTNGKIDFSNPWIEGLKVSLSGAVDKFSRGTRRFQTPWYLYNWDKRSYEADGKTPLLQKSVRSTFADPRLTQGNENALNINLTALLTYDHTFGDHTVGFLAGTTKETRNADNFNAFRRYFISPAVDQLFAGGAAEQNVGGSASNQARLSYFGRVAYNYREKYLAEFLWRNDGSYIFPEDKRFGFFPGVLVGWNISKENFFKVPFVNNLKIRASYGQLGNDRIAEYQYLPTYAFGTQVINSAVQTTLRERVVPNPDITWEVANNSDIGLEGSLFNNKVFFELDYFYNKRSKILIPRGGSTPSSSGIRSLLPPVNLGKLDNKGYEFRVGYNGKAGDLTFSVSVNGGYAKNKIIFWDEAPGLQPYQTSTGRSYGTNGANFLAYVYDGVFRDEKEIAANTINYSAATGTLRPGDMKFKDVGGPGADGAPDGKIDSWDRVRLDKNRDPTFTGGMSLNMQYHNFDLSLLMQGATGGLLLFNVHETGDFGNYLKYSYEHRWSVDNPSSVDPRLANRGNTYYTNDGQNFGNNTYFLRPSNYLRLKNIEIGYNLGGLGKKIGISRFKVYVNALNLYTWDKMKIWDPESTASNGQYYPQSRIINTGVRVTF
ncbi:SusC/RagA family TonB-linked outer membrane protein [Segetibacter aerophilus]|uniref:SusC/RagA family TonB-linked outer membrane protein n=1 Tax=Segetibacter aerophilus TaxID=670293 RepID=A0A512BEM9_9BACT|nr:TonB-dependent receptor [Segetibacter aerophilus]GEO10433.1 SusC/RagA family TonB-linked outer membrane protein [Segetibacter aerophilus]